MSLKRDIAYLREALKNHPKAKPVDPVDSMPLDELDAEIARLDAELLELGMTPEEIGVESHPTSVGYWTDKGYSPENAEKLSNSL